ncbi:MAG: L,D-transpeptidase family protein [Minisyncoccales bacterium]
MTHPRTTKIRNKLARLKYHIGRKERIGIAAAGAVLIFGAVWWAALHLPRNYETDIPEQPRSYIVSPIACGYSRETANLISLRFKPAEPAIENMPAHKIEEIDSEAKTVITFNDVSEIDGQFSYEEIVDSPLIDSIDCDIKDGDLVIEINRKGAYLPARVEIQNSRAIIILEPATKDYPIISNQKPADNSAAFPALHPISFDAALSDPLKNALVFFQGKPANFAATSAAGNNYHFSFSEILEINRDYTVKAIITDNQNRTTVSTWTFTGQIPGAAALGKDRFKYLGWWGQINSNGVAVRKGFAITSDKIGTLSSANRVKILKEVYGDWVDGKNLWYQIDGGMYAGAYVFSDYVTPMAQPLPPQNFSIPEKVKIGEKWIDVDLTEKILTLFDYDKPVFATYISPGRSENPTQTGTYRIWYKLAKAKMQGGPPLHSYQYNLENIPWTMYYNYDYAIHGTYWHDRFGTAQSAGCTNMTQGDAKFIFENTLPELPEGQEEVFAREKPNVGYGTGTVVYNHD